MLTVQGRKGNISVILLWMFVVVSMTGCIWIDSPEERFSRLEEVGNSYETYGGYDVREMAEQVDGYWDYYKENEAQQEKRLQQADNWQGNWIGEGEYIVGEDIPEGLYLVKSIDGPIANITRNSKNEKGELVKNYHLIYSLSYFLLNKGENITVKEDAVMTLAENINLLLPCEDGIYYEGAYKVGEEIPEGEYFMLSMDTGEGVGSVSNERDELIEIINRFGYVTIQGDLVVNLQECILISPDQKPKVAPVSYQGEGEGEGKQVFAFGMYKVGEDIPIGTYKMKNELYKSISDLAYKGYHGNVSYDAGEHNWCGIEVKRDEHVLQLGWSEIELDAYISSKKRYIKITDNKGEISYKGFDGLPTVTFTEKDIGSIVEVYRSILIPVTDGS